MHLPAVEVHLLNTRRRRKSRRSTLLVADTDRLGWNELAWLDGRFAIGVGEGSRLLRGDVGGRW